MRTKFISRVSRGLLSVVIVAATTLYPLRMITKAEDAVSSQPVTETTATINTPADESTDTAQTTSPTPSQASPEAAPNPPQPQTGPAAPTGADANKYTYNEATGLWENDFYTWNPVTKQTAPKTPQTYSYNPNSGKWETTEWVYDTTSGSYQPNVVDTAALPENAVVSPESLEAAVSSTGPGSTNTVDSSSSSTGTFDLFYNADISNSINSTARSGNVSAARNTLVGDAASGNATDMANIINLLQSSWSPVANNKFSTFVATIEGDVFGDLYVDPNQGPGANTSVTDDKEDNLDIDVEETARVNNEINLVAESGDVDVTRNTTAGDATTGNATAVANVVNVLNSSIAAGESFLGVINIEGSLIGDILLPENVLNSLIASSGPSSTNTIASGTDSTTTANFTNDHSITNNVNVDADSGDAVVARNTNAGSATTGSATTNVTLLNLTGRQIIGDNALLVFVNVLGRWTGLIMDAPAGTTSAAVGGGITENTLSGTQNTDIDVANSSTINNDINVRAASGDARITENTNAGNARTGNAQAGVNIANVANSQLSLANWFGILFINVLGSWQGSFGVNTAAGNTPTPVRPPVASNGASSTAPEPEVFQFVPAQANRNNNIRLALSDTDESPAAETEPQKTVVLASTDTPTVPPTESEPKQKKKVIDWIPATFGGLTAMGLLGLERASSRRKKLHVR